jgi:hypothetical protein
VLVAGGVQEKFSWNAVALAAIGGGITKGLTAASDGSGWIATALKSEFVRGALSSAITQGIGDATGLQKDDFSWAGVAAAGVSASVGQLAADGRGGVFAQVTASALAHAATRSLIDGSDFGDNIMAALPDVIGQTIGEAMAGRLMQRSERPIDPIAVEELPPIEFNSTELPDPPRYHTVRARESFWVLAKRDLGPEASAAAIRARVRQYMEVNSGVDPRRLREGYILTVPSDSVTVSPETAGRYVQSDREYRRHLAAQAEQARVGSSRLDSHFDENFQLAQLAPFVAPLVRPMPPVTRPMPMPELLRPPIPLTPEMRQNRQRNYDQCRRAADGSTAQWERYCRSLPNRTPSDRQLREGCWSLAHRTPIERQNWCYEQFGDWRDGYASAQSSVWQ